MIGSDIDTNNSTLMKQIASLRLTPRVRLLGKRTDIARMMNALDILTSSSTSGEGFPNVIGEAMSCGVPCVATDVGDSAEIVGNTGIIVEPGNSAQLARAWDAMIDMGEEGRRRLGDMARARISHRYSLDLICRRYEQLYRDMASATGDH